MKGFDKSVIQVKAMTGIVTDIQNVYYCDGSIIWILPVSVLVAQVKVTTINLESFLQVRP